MLSGGKPAAARSSRNGPCRSFQTGILRPCLSLPSPVSTRIRRVGVSTTSEWIDIFRRPSSVAKCGISHGSFWISSRPANGKMNRVWPTVSISTILVIFTRPMVQCMQHFLQVRCRRAGWISGAGYSQCLQRARESAAIKQDILSGDEAGLGAAQEGAGEAKFLGVAEASRRIELGAFGQHLIGRDAALVGVPLRGAAQAVGVER